MPNDSNNHRKYFRLGYPVEAMPTIEIKDTKYPVSEISEKGLRIRCEEFNRFRVGELITGRITFFDGKTVSVSGTILRHDRQDYVLGHMSGLTQPRLMTEQRYVIKRRKPQMDND